MERRNFFRNSALYAGTALAAAQNFSFAGGEFSGILKKGIKFSMVREPGLLISERLQLLRDLGFDGTELYISDRDRRVEFRKASEQTGFKIHGVMTSIDSDLSAAIEFAAEVGADSVTYRAQYDKKKSLMDNWQASQSIIREAIATSEKHDVAILIENAWSSFLISALDMERYINEINHPNVLIYFDVANNARLGLPEHWIEFLGGRIGKLHIKEWDESSHRVEGGRGGLKAGLGEGTINWPKVRCALRQSDFSGWATASFPGGDRLRLLDISQRMDDVLGLV